MTKIKKKFTEPEEESEQKAEETEKTPERHRRWKYKRKKFIIPKEEKQKKPLTNEEKLYYAKMLVAFLSGLIGRLCGLIGWWMLLYMVLFWFVAPFPIGLLIAPYEKDKWDWKMFMKTAVAAFFFIFIVTTTIIHTLIITSDPAFVAPW